MAFGAHRRSNLFGPPAHLYDWNIVECDVGQAISLILSQSHLIITKFGLTRLQNTQTKLQHTAVFLFMKDTYDTVLINIIPLTTFQMWPEYNMHVHVSRT